MYRVARIEFEKALRVRIQTHAIIVVGVFLDHEAGRVHHRRTEGLLFVDVDEIGHAPCRLVSASHDILRVGGAFDLELQFAMGRLRIQRRLRLERLLVRRRIGIRGAGDHFNHRVVVGGGVDFIGRRKRVDIVFVALGRVHDFVGVRVFLVGRCGSPLSVRYRGAVAVGVTPSVGVVAQLHEVQAVLFAKIHHRVNFL